MKRVVITGIGMLSSLGIGHDEIWPKIKDGISGVDFLKKVDASDLKTKFGAEVSPDFNAEDFMDAKEARRSDPFIRFAVAAASLALKDSKLEINDSNSHLVGSYIGSGIGGIQTFVDNTLVYNDKGPSRVSPFFVPSMVPNMAAGYVSIFNNLKGPNCAACTACAAGAHSIGYAAMMIERGDAVAMVAGGAEAPLVHVAISGFNVMRAISTRNDNPSAASRPFDNDRDGFVMGEGSGLIVLEEMEHAKKRGANIYAELIGYGMSGDAHHITAPAEDGDGGYRAMKASLEMANIPTDKVDYINAHGTSTIKGDEIEINAISKLFKHNIFVSSTKSSIGHLLGAAGSVESIFSIMSLNENILPATLNLNNPISTTNIDLIPKVPKEKNISYALSNSFGFGGTNTALLFKSI